MNRTRWNSGWRVAAAGAMLLVGACGAMAQAPEGTPPEGGPPPGRMWRGGQDPERQLHMLTRLLTLTADQQKGVKTVLDQQAAEMKALREKAPADPSTGQTAETREARMTQMNQIREESNTKISALLDENQKKTFADWNEKRKERMERRQGPPPDGGDAPPPPPPPSE